MMNAQVTESAVRAVLDEKGIYASTITGVSMRPLLKTDRDMVVIKKHTEDLKKYDIALYFVKGKHILHRVLKVCENEYLIRGDNTFTVEHIPKDAVLGVAAIINRNGKRIDLSDKKCTAYAKFWHFIYPIRYLIFRIKGIACGIFRRVFPKKPKD